QRVKEQKSPPDDQRVKEHMLKSKIFNSYKAVFQPLLPDVDMSHPAAYTARHAARALIDDPSFRRDFVRLVVSITEDDKGLGRLWNDVMVRAQIYRQPGMDKEVMLRILIIYASEWFAHHRGSQNAWTYTETAELENSLRQVLLSNLGASAQRPTLKSFQDLM